MASGDTPVEITSSSSPSSASSFGFAWNQPRYSDRVLRLHLSGDDKSAGGSSGSGSRNGSDASRSPDKRAPRPLKRRRCNPASPSSVSDAYSVAIQCEAVVVDRPTHTEDVPVSSVILAKECLFFRRLFDGECFKEAKEKIIDIHLKLEEKKPFLALLQFMYTGKLEADTAEEIAAVWLLAQRFLAQSCMEHSMRELRKFPLTVERSNYFLDLASVVDQTEDLKALMNMSISFLANHFSTATVMNAENPGRWEHSDDFQKLPINALELLVKSDLLQAVHEEAVFHAVRSWAKANCKTVQEERAAWKRLGPLIRWPLIEAPRLKTLSTAPEAEDVHSLIVEALLYKASTEDEQQRFVSAHPSSLHRFRRRVRHALAVQCVSMSLPVKHAIVCFHLSLQAWRQMQSSSGPLCSERFCVGGFFFIWLLQLVKNGVDSPRRRVSVGLVSLSAPPTPIRVEIQVSVWDANRQTFASKYMGVHTVKREVRERIAMCLDCFGKDLDEILDERNGYLFQDATWFRAEVKVGNLDSNPAIG